jgi:hypothetical protein
VRKSAWLGVCARGQRSSISHAAEGEFGGFRAESQLIDGNRAQRGLGIFGKPHVVETHERNVTGDFDFTGFWRAEDLEGQEIVGAKDAIRQVRGIEFKPSTHRLA